MLHWMFYSYAWNHWGSSLCQTVSHVWNDFAFGMTQKVDFVAVIINLMSELSPVSFRDKVFDFITRGKP